MSDSILEQLQALWDELDQATESREQRELEQRLSDRARQYAAPQKSDSDDDNDNAYRLLTFSLGRERYGIDVSLVRGVRPASRLTRVPGVPTYYRGVVNVRGQIISVLDLRRFFNLDVSDQLPARELVLVEAQDLTLALLADHVEDVLTIPHDAVEPVEMTYAHGVTMGRLVVLNCDILFADDRLIINRETKA